MSNPRHNSTTKRKKDGTPSAIQDGTWGGFVNVRLTEVDKAAALGWMTETRDELWPMFEDILDKGFKVSFTWDKTNQCFICTLTGEGTEQIGLPGKYALSGRAETFDRALQLTLWKHYIHLRGNWSNAEMPQGQLFNFG